MIYEVGKYRIDTETFRLFRGEREVALEPLEFDLLVYLLEHRDRVVTRDELLTQLWPGKFVSDSALSSRIKSLRRALGDSGAAQKVVRTAHGRGYQFVAMVASASTPRSVVSTGEAPNVEATRQAFPFAGRQKELADLDRHLQQAMEGRCQIVFVLGEGGIGKTSLVETFALGRCADSGAAVLRGQCLGESDVVEPYFPLLDAVRRGARANLAEDVVSVISLHAPTWQSRFPDLLPERGESPSEGVAHRDRMLLELTDAFVALTERRPLVLILEDLQWADPSTLEWLDYISRRDTPSRLMILCTVRTGEASNEVTRRAAGLSLRGRAGRVVLPSLDRTAVGDYLTARLGRPATSQTIEDLCQFTGGQPLYMRLVVDGWLSSAGEGEPLGDYLQTIPGTLMELVEFGLASLDPGDVDLLECAAVAGFEFSAPLVAGQLEIDESGAELRLLELSRVAGNPLVAGEVEWPDGTRSTLFRFGHHFFARVLYDRQPAMLRQQRHGAVARRLMERCGEATDDRASEIAEHLARAGRRSDALAFFEAGARVAAGRGASREAAELIRKALDLLAHEPESRGRDSRELALLVALGNAHISSDGYAATETVRVYEQARLLSARLDTVGGDPQLLPVLYGLWNNAIVGGRIGESLEIAERFLSLASVSEAERGDARAVALRAVAWPELLMGRFASAASRLREAIDCSSEGSSEATLAFFGEHARVAALGTLSWALWFLGDVDGALRASRSAMSLAESLRHPLTLAYAYAAEGNLLQFIGNASAALVSSQRAVEHAEKYDLPLFVAWASGVVGWARCALGGGEEGLAMMRESSEAAGVMGARVFLTAFLAARAEQTLSVGEPLAAMEVVDAALALAEQTGERYFEAELLRLRGQVLLALPRRSWRVASDAFARALETARRQGSPTLELRTLLAWSEAEVRHRKVGNATAELAAFRDAPSHSGLDSTPEMARARYLLEGQMPGRRQ